MTRDSWPPSMQLLIRYVHVKVLLSMPGPCVRKSGGGGGGGRGRRVNEQFYIEFSLDLDNQG